MTTLPFFPADARPSFRPVVQWQFTRGVQAIECDVLARGRHLYEVCVVPFLDPEAAVVETYDDAARALQRHAEIAWFLQESGWAVDQHTPAVPAA